MTGEYWSQYGFTVGGTIEYQTFGMPYYALAPYPQVNMNLTPFTYQSDAWRVDVLERKVARLERQVRRLRAERIQRVRRHRAGE